MTAQSEAALEMGLIDTLKQMDYEYVQIIEEENLQSNFKRQLERHNRKQLAEHGRTEFTAEEFDKILIHLEGGTRFEKAKKLRDLYPLDIAEGKRIWVEFLNRHQWCQNEFQVSNQITVEGRKKCRYDVTILVNGLPLVQIELKKRGVELKQAYNQVQRYHKTSFHGLFDYIQLFVISNGVNTRYFANNPNSGYKFTFNWTDAENVPFNDLSMFAQFFFDKCTLGKMLSKYIVLHEGDKCLMALRPYQYYAVERILDKVQNSNKNGYIWHTTGAGKTLTSFKAAQLVSEIDGIDKVMFVVDRHDLDTQTQSEYEAFEPGAVDGTDNTRELIKRLSGNSKIIITTIQKLNCAVTRNYYNKHLQEVKDQKVVMIFDECHRSHFGECHKNIVHFFKNLQIFGFTGTPIFSENAIGEHTTAEVFGDCLHRYLIKDAIADENVLGFLVEYYQENGDVDVMEEKRMREIAQFILNNFNKSTYDGDFNALFAIQSVPMLLRYYKIFKELNPKIRIGAVFTYAANDSQDDEQTGMNQGFANNQVTADELQAIMDDYNGIFHTNFSTDNFSAYYDDIN
ncbi:MAG: type I restriction endonuclease subunit R, partial [Alloprevotella sp.]